MAKNRNLIDEKFKDDNLPITEDMINEESPMEPTELPNPSPYDQRDIYMVVVIISCIILFSIIIKNGTSTTTDIVSLITVSISFVSTILTIPIIITKSLFPEKEDNQIIDVLTKLIENDDNIRNNKNIK